MKQPLPWPDLPEIKSKDRKEVIELKKSLYQAKLDIYKAQQQAIFDIEKARKLAAIEEEAADKLATVERVKAAYSHEYALEQAIHNAYVDVAKQQVAAPGNKAEFVQKASTAISAAYVAVVGLSFGIGEHNKVLPLSGLLPTIFLGLSIFLATAYTAYISDPGTTLEESSEGTLPGHQRERRNTFIIWAQSVALGRRKILHSAIISLGFAIGYLPAPYLQMDNIGFMILAVMGILCSLLVPMAINDKASSKP